MTKLEPIHPGEILKYDFMEPSGLSAVTLSTETGVPTRHINEIACGSREISADTARRFAEYFGTDSQSWMNLQSHYNDAIAKREQVHSISSKIAGFLWPDSRTVYRLNLRRLRDWMTGLRLGRGSRAGITEGDFRNISSQSRGS